MNLTPTSTPAEYTAVFELEVGTTVKMVHPLQFETVLYALEKYKPTTIDEFTVGYIYPGHPLFTTTGPNCLVILVKTLN